MKDLSLRVAAMVKGRSTLRAAVSMKESSLTTTSTVSATSVLLML